MTQNIENMKKCGMFKECIASLCPRDADFE